MMFSAADKIKNTKTNLFGEYFLKQYIIVRDTNKIII